MTLRALADLIVEVLFVGNLPMIHQVSNDKDMTNKTEWHPFEKLKDCGKIRFESRDDLILSLQEHFPIPNCLTLFDVSKGGEM